MHRYRRCDRRAVGDWFNASNVTNHVHRSRLLHPPPGKGDLEPLPFLRQKLDVVIIGSRSHRLRLQALASKGDKPLYKYGSIAEDCTVKLPEVDLRKLLKSCETKLLGGGLETMLLVTVCVSLSACESEGYRLREMAGVTGS